MLLAVGRQLWLWKGLADLIFLKCHSRSCPGLGSPAQDVLLFSLKGVSAAVDGSRSGFFVVAVLLGAMSEGNAHRTGLGVLPALPQAGGRSWGGLT